MKKNIWVFCQDGGTPEQGWGERHYFLAKNYIRSGHKVTIFSANQSHLFSKGVEFDGAHWLTEYKGLKYCWIKVPPYTKPNSFKRIVAWFIFSFRLFFLPKKSQHRPDLIIVSSMPMFPILPALFYKMIWRCKVIFEVRDIWPLTITDMGKYSRFNPFVILLSLMERMAYRFSDYHVSVLDNAEKHIRATIRKPIRFAWISNGIDSEVIIKDAKIDENILDKIPKDKFIVVYAGKIGLSNANEFIIEAARLLNANEKIHFVFVGDGDEKITLIQQSVGLKNVTFIPKVKKHNLHTLLCKFDAAIISFRMLNLYQYGISSNKLFDYMMAGLPIIMATDHQPDAYLKSGSIILTQPENPQAIADTILKVSAMSTELRQAIGQKSREFVNQNFLYEKLAGRYEDVFQSL